MIDLRPYQSDLTAATRDAMRQHKAVCVVLPTGGGKTLTLGWMVAGAAQNGKRAIFCVHRVELLEQTARAFRQLDIAHGFIAASEDYDSAPLVHIASIDTLRRRLDKVERPDLLIVDEFHHAPSESWKQVVNFWPDIHKIGLTATPERLDGKGLKHVADTLVIGPTTRWLIENKYLAPYKIYAPAQPDLTDVRASMGDYKNNELAMVMDKASITGCAIDHYLKICPDKQAVVFAVNIEHSKHVAEQFLARGIPAAHLDGKISKLQREDIVERFRYGETRVLSNVNICTEGFDLPALDAAILLRPTKSLSLYLQMVGRALRYQDGKTALILDHAGNSILHGMPDMERDWSLDGKLGRPLPKFIIAVCEECFYTWEKKRHEPKICPACGHAHKQERKAVEAADGSLVELTEEEMQWLWARHASLSKVMGKVKCRADLQAIAKVRAYKPGWVFYRAKEMGLRE